MHRNGVLVLVVGVAIGSIQAHADEPRTKKQPVPPSQHQVEIRQKLRSIPQAPQSNQDLRFDEHFRAKDSMTPYAPPSSSPEF